MHWAIILIRLLLPISIIRWPLFGGLAALFLDGIDWHLQLLLGFPTASYQPYDKFLDLYYLSFEAFIILSSPHKLIRQIALFLFLGRIIGIVGFEITQLRTFLVIFPNVFESFYLFLMFKNTFYSNMYLRKTMLYIIVAVLTIPKLIQEYQMHLVDYATWRFINIDILAHTVKISYDVIGYQMAILCLLLLSTRYFYLYTKK